MHAQSAPTIALDASIGVLDYAFSAGFHDTAIFTGNAWKTALRIRCVAIYAAIGSVYKLIGQFSRVKGHFRGRGGTYQGHDNGRPAEGSPAIAMRWWLRKIWA